MIIWLEIPQIGTFRARYRAENYNVANAKVSTIDDDGKAHVAHEDGDEEDHTKVDLQELTEAYAKELFKEIVNGIVPAFDYLEYREHSFLICELVQLFKLFNVAVKKTSH